MRIIYGMENGFISSIDTENYEGTYFCFVSDNSIVVNRWYKDAITKDMILFDLEIIAKYKEKGFIPFKQVKGVSPHFIELAKKYDISEKEIMEAINSGKNYNKRKHYNNGLATESNSRLTGFTVGQ